MDGTKKLPHAPDFWVGKWDVESGGRTWRATFDAIYIPTAP